jgi:peptide/nickel transport system permease protein
MGKFILRRVSQLVLVLFAVTFLTFSALNVVGDPLFNIVGLIAGTDCDAVASGEIEDEVTGASGETSCEIIAAAEEEYNLDKSVPVRYGLWISDMVTGDFGTSYVTGDEVSTVVKNRLPITLRLVVYAQIIALGIAIPWGVAAARRANRGFDRVTTVGSFALLAIPNFALGVVLLYVFTLKYEILPPSYSDDGWYNETKSLLLPALTLGLGLSASYQRLLRTDLITTLQDDFVHMARAKGLPPRRIMYRHALRPSLFSVITVFGVNTGALIGGSLVVEQIFNIPGLGSAVVTAVLRDDPPVVVALVAIIAVGFVLINFLVDLFYTWLDPRVRAS